MSIRSVCSRTALAIVLVALAAIASSATGPLWTHHHQRSLRPAAEQAEFERKRLLIGLSGGELCCVSEHLVDGPLAQILDEDEVHTAAEPFVRLLIKDPEAGLFERGMDTRWPSLLVLDPDGRRVDALQFVPQVPRMVGPARVAEFLADAAEATPEERFEATVDGPEEVIDALVERLSALPGVRRARLVRGRLLVRAKPSGLPPHTLLSLIEEAEGVTGDVVEPVRIRLAGWTDDALDVRRATRWLEQVPGVWYVEHPGKPGARRIDVWMPNHMLEPEALTRAARGWSADATTETFQFAALPEGREAAATAARLYDLPGVLAVHADLFDRRMRVVVRRPPPEHGTSEQETGDHETTDRDTLLASLVEWGCVPEGAEPPPDGPDEPDRDE